MGPGQALGCGPGDGFHGQHGDRPVGLHRFEAGRLSECVDVEPPATQGRDVNRPEVQPSAMDAPALTVDDVNEGPNHGVHLTYWRSEANPLQLF